MATWKLRFSIFLVLFAAVACIKRDLLDIYDSKSPLKLNSHVLNSESISSNINRRSKRSTSTQRQDCEASEDSYKKGLEELDPNQKGFVTEVNLGDDTHPQIALSFIGIKYVIAVTQSSGFLGSEANLYISSDGSRTFTRSNEKVNNESIQPTNGLQQHGDTTYVLTHDKSLTNVYHVTASGAELQFKKCPMPVLFVGLFKFHPTKPEYVLALDESDLYISKDGGCTWKHILKGGKVQNVKWSQKSDKILASVSIAEDKFSLLSLLGLGSIDSYDNDLKVSSDLGETWTTKKEHIYSFGVQDKFTYVSVFLNKELMEEGERALEVSTDEGETWAEVQLPSITSDQFYSILDMSEGMVFVHVDTPDDTGEGTLYTSDSTGIVYSESLTRHLYPNYEDATDFYKVNSIRGVYITSQLMEDNSIRTMISFDRGGEWTPIVRPYGASCKDEDKGCYLQIHNVFSRLHSVLENPPLSSASAPGIIMVHGHVAESLQTTEPSVFVSSDGGYSWNKTSLDGPQHYQIADQGGVLVAVPLEEKPTKLHFSTDEGLCWHEYTFTNDPDITFKGLLVDPGNMDHSVVIWGHDKDRHWRIFVIDFSAIITRKCGSEDMKEWRPHGDVHNTENEYDGCLLGRKETFSRLKQEAWCLINGGQQLGIKKNGAECKCTKADYECAYGYERLGKSEVCVEDKKFKGPKIEFCKQHEVYEEITAGYRKIPGDVCKGGFKPQGKLVDLHKVCVEGDTDLLEDQIKEKYLPQEDEPDKAPLITGKAFLWCVVATIALALAIVAIVVTRKRVLRQRLGRYRYAAFGRQGYGTDSGQGEAPTHTPLYDDVSDDELAGADNDVTPRPTTEQNGGLSVSADDVIASSNPHPIIAPTLSSNQIPANTASQSAKSKKTKNDEELLILETDDDLLE